MTTYEVGAPGANWRANLPSVSQASYHNMAGGQLNTLETLNAIVVASKVSIPVPGYAGGTP